MNRAALKQRTKQLVRRTVGEPYVGKRLKMHAMNDVLARLTISPSAILDAGTEDATFVYWLADRFPGATVTAVDIDGDAIAACLAARPDRYRSRVRFEVSTFASLAPEAFDLVTAFDVLEHIDDDAGAVAQLTRALRPGGTLLVHVPRDQWTSWSGAVERVPDAEAWRINPGHVRQGYSPKGMRQLLEEAGLEVCDIQTWLGRWGVAAHAVYARLERPAVLRLLSIPATDLLSFLDRRAVSRQGNTVFARAIKSELAPVSHPSA